MTIPFYKRFTGIRLSPIGAHETFSEHLKVEKYREEYEASVIAAEEARQATHAYWNNLVEDDMWEDDEVVADLIDRFNKLIERKKQAYQALRIALLQSSDAALQWKLSN